MSREWCEEVNNITVEDVTFTGTLLGPAGSTGSFGRVNADSVRVNNVYELPTSDGTSGQVLTTNGAGTLSFQPVTETDPSALAFAIALG